MRHRTGWRWLVAIIFLLIAGCGGGESPSETSAPPSPKEPVPLEIIASDFAFDITSPVPAGTYDFTLVNQGEAAHHADFYRLNEGVTFEEFQEALLSSEPAFGGFPAEVGELMVSGSLTRVSRVGPGESGTGRGELEPGVHAVVCAIDVIKGTTVTPHYALGMMSEVQVK